MVVVSCLLCYMARLGAIAAYARTQENGKISLYRGCSFLDGCDILGLVQQIGIFSGGYKYDWKNLSCWINGF